MGVKTISDLEQRIDGIVYSQVCTGGGGAARGQWVKLLQLLVFLKDFFFSISKISKNLHFTVRRAIRLIRIRKVSPA